MTFEWFKSIFAFSFLKSKEEVKLLPTEMHIKKVKNRDMEIVEGSHKYIKKFDALCKLTTGLPCNDRFMEVLEAVSKVHDKCVSDDTVPLIRLEEYHNYYTDQFLNAFDRVLDPLRPKPKVDERLKSDFVLGKEEETGSVLFEDYVKEVEIEEVKEIPLDIVSISSLVDDLDPKKEDGYDSFSKGYASYMNEVFGFERKAKKSYNLIDSSKISNYRLLYLGESNIHSQPVLAEVIDLSSNDGHRQMDSVCMVMRLDIDSSKTTIVNDVSNYYNKGLIKEITK